MSDSPQLQEANRYLNLTRGKRLRTYGFEYLSWLKNGAVGLEPKCGAKGAPGIKAGLHEILGPSPFEAVGAGAARMWSPELERMLPGPRCWVSFTSGGMREFRCTLQLRHASPGHLHAPHPGFIRGCCPPEAGTTTVAAEDGEKGVAALLEYQRACREREGVDVPEAIAGDVLLPLNSVRRGLAPWKEHAEQAIGNIYKLERQVRAGRDLALRFEAETLGRLDALRKRHEDIVRNPAAHGAEHYPSYCDGVDDGIATATATLGEIQDTIDRYGWRTP